MSDYLPEHVIVKIFIKLPVKALGRCTCLSKRWRSIISDPLFARLHYKQGPPSRRLLISKFDHGEFMYSLNLEGRFEDIRKLASPIKMLVDTLGSCNGLVCVTASCRTTPYIWNPSTGMVQELPPPDFPEESNWFGIRHGGFGYLSATDDYKVVACTYASDVDVHLFVQVFSLRAQVWKTIQSLPGPHLYLRDEHSLLFNEALHWITKPSKHGPAIMALDLATDQFRIMPLPNIVYAKAPEDDFDICILVSGGYLCYIGADFICPVPIQFGYLDLNSIDLWMMREYGVSDSWTKLYNLRISNQPERITRFQPIWVMETSVIVELWSEDDGRKFVRTELEGGTTDNVVIHRKNDRTYTHIAYEESLIWINDCYGAGEKVKRLKTKHEDSGNLE